MIKSLLSWFSTFRRVRPATFAILSYALPFVLFVVFAPFITSSSVPIWFKFTLLFAIGLATFPILLVALDSIRRRRRRR